MAWQHQAPIFKPQHDILLAALPWNDGHGGYHDQDKIWRIVSQCAAASTTRVMLIGVELVSKGLEKEALILHKQYRSAIRHGALQYLRGSNISHAVLI